MMLKLADAIEADADEPDPRSSPRTSASRSLSRAADIPFIIDNLRFFAGAARMQEGEVHRGVRARASRA